jgi:hypothetical protein
MTTPHDPDDRELDALLRQPTERLAPTAHTWDDITRRARRRKWAKASLAVAAGVAVVAGAVPAVIAVHGTGGDGGDQTLQQVASQQTSPQPNSTMASPRPVPVLSSTAATPAATLNGYTPISVSFDSQSEGWLWGSTTHLGPGVIAHTVTDGASWLRMPSAPPVNATDPEGGGDYAIRFATGDIGYVFGSQTFITQDKGQSWQPMSFPGRVVDLEAMNQRVWALVTTCSTCKTMRLYGAAAAAPTAFTAVRGVPLLRGMPGDLESGYGSIAVDGTSVYVMAGSAALWASPDGVKWVKATNPCGPADDFANAVSAWSPSGVAAGCGSSPAAGDQGKQVFESTNRGSTWTQLPSPSTAGELTSVSAGTQDHVIVGVSMGAGYVTNDRGQHWVLSPTHGVNLSFVGFISDNHVVGVPSTASGQGGFLTSHSAGQTWHLTSFPH